MLAEQTKRLLPWRDSELPGCTGSGYLEVQAVSNKDPRHSKCPVLWHVRQSLWMATPPPPTSLPLRRPKARAPAGNKPGVAGVVEAPFQVVFLATKRSTTVSPPPPKQNHHQHQQQQQPTKKTTTKTNKLQTTNNRPQVTNNKQQTTNNKQHHTSCQVRYEAPVFVRTCVSSSNCRSVCCLCIYTRL